MTAVGLFDRAPHRVTIVEVGPRDGLQNESAPVPTAAKLALIRDLAAAGLGAIEATAFVHPTAVPQMADAGEVMRALAAAGSATRLIALVPNARGYERARAAGAAEVAVFTAASETFSRRNTNATVAESMARIAEVLALARAGGVPVRGYVSTAWHCPYEGRVDTLVVERLADELLAGGAWQVSLGDTIGAATPGEVAALVERLLTRTPASQLALHCHDTRGTALANVLVGLQLGLSTFDASVGGLGGCPFAPGAAGNLATEDLVYLLDGLGIETGVDLDRLVQAAATLEPLLGRELSSRTYRARRAA